MMRIAFFHNDVASRIHAGVAGTMVALFASLVLGMVSGIESASASEPVPPPARLVLARAGRLMEDERYPEAVEALTAFAARGGSMPASGRPDPRGYHHPLIDFALGNAHLMQEALPQAENAYRRALARDPGLADAWANLAGVYYRRKQYAEAGKCFLQSYETAAEKPPERLFYSAAAFLNAGRNKQSIGLLERLLADHPADGRPAWKETLVHALLAADQAQRALPYIRQRVQTSEGEQKIRWQEILLQQYLQLEMQQEALALVRALTREQPTEVRWWKALAHVHLTDSRYEDALAALVIYSWLGEPTEEEQRLLADLHLQVGIPVKAAPMYAALLQRSPDKRLLQNLVAAYRRLGRPEAGLQQLDQFAGPVSDAEMLMLRGDLLYALGRYDEAAAVYRQAARSNDRQAGRAWLMAGYAAWQNDDLSKSRRDFQRAAGFGDQQEAARLAMRRLDRMRQ